MQEVIRTQQLIDKHPDIQLILNRMYQLLQEEEYEKVAVLQVWLNDLMDYYEKKKSL